MPAWSFLTNHARVLLCIAHDPGLRLRDIAATLGITERSAHGIITDLATAGYVVKHKDGRRNRYQIQAHLPLPEPWTREPALSEILTVLLGDSRSTTALADHQTANRRPGRPPGQMTAATVNARGSDVLGPNATGVAGPAFPQG